MFNPCQNYLVNPSFCLRTCASLLGIDPTVWIAFKPNGLVNTDSFICWPVSIMASLKDTLYSWWHNYFCVPLFREIRLPEKVRLAIHVLTILFRFFLLFNNLTSSEYIPFHGIISFFVGVQRFRPHRRRLSVDPVAWCLLHRSFAVSLQIRGWQ